MESDREKGSRQRVREFRGMERIDRIIRAERDADKHEATASDLHWEAAQLISEELAAGTTQKELAEKIHKSQSHVSKCNKLWLQHSQENNKPAWSKAYNKVSSRPKKEQPEPTVSEPTETVVAETPETAPVEAEPRSLDDEINDKFDDELWGSLMGLAIMAYRAGGVDSVREKAHRYVNEAFNEAARNMDDEAADYNTSYLARV